MILISDATLRDGNHSVRHQLSEEQIARYAADADAAGIDIIEVGHGNGLGGSSALLGQSKVSDAQVLEIARASVKQAQLGVHFIPGFGKAADLHQAISKGVDVFRIACHCTEANITAPYIEMVKNNDRTAYGVLMMSHMASQQELIAQVRLLDSYGADAIILMDSAGYMTPDEVRRKIDAMLQATSLPLGFHAHNNLSLAVANSLAAVEEGVSIVDACIKGFGAGAGNTQLEPLIAVLARYGIQTRCTFENAARLSAQADAYLDCTTPHIPSANIASGLHGLFSGFVPHVRRAAAQFEVDEFKLYEQLSLRELVAGQEDIIVEVAAGMAKTANA
jgi:4-hydroxy 2-oxovalerate aldolase